jgi:polyhydroxyalkanoate synthesis regulator phasin
MAQNPIRTTIDSTRDAAGSVQERLQAVLRQISRTTEEQAALVQAALADLVERSRENSERLAQVVEKQVQAQLTSLGLATRADIARLERKIETLRRAQAAASKRSPTAGAARSGARSAKAASTKGAPAGSGTAAAAKAAPKRGPSTKASARKASS